MILRDLSKIYIIDLTKLVHFTFAKCLTFIKGFIKPFKFYNLSGLGLIPSEILVNKNLCMKSASGYKKIWLVQNCSK